jgi:hypothetical protein
MPSITSPFMGTLTYINEHYENKCAKAFKVNPLIKKKAREIIRVNFYTNKP